MDMSGKKRVLAADDDLDTLDIIKIKLEGAGYQVDTVTDGRMALSKVRSEPPDILILDVMLPKLNGFKVARLLKFDAKLKSMPIILLTARTQAQDQNIGEMVGVEEYVTKPFDPNALLALVNRYLQK